MCAYPQPHGLWDSSHGLQLESCYNGQEPPTTDLMGLFLSTTPSTSQYLVLPLKAEGLGWTELGTFPGHVWVVSLSPVRKPTSRITWEE